MSGSLSSTGVGGGLIRQIILYVEELAGGRPTQPEIFLCMDTSVLLSDSPLKCFGIAGGDVLKQRFDGMISLLHAQDHHQMTILCAPMNYYTLHARWSCCRLQIVYKLTNTGRWVLMYSVHAECDNSLVHRV